MPRITPLPLLLLVRVVLLVVPLFYIGLVLLWVGLPSPAGSWEKDPSARLWRGESVVRVYDLDAFFPWNDDSPSVQDARRTGRTSFALEYTYDRTTSALTIGSMRGSGSGSGNDASRGGGGIEVHGVTVNLVELLSLSSIDGEAAAAATPPWLSAPFSVRVKTGDQDGINLPWFAKADASLLFWEIHGDVVDLPLRWRVVREKTTAQTRGEIVVSETTVQIVPAVGAWDTQDETEPGSRPYRHDEIEPLLSIAFNPASMSTSTSTSVASWSLMNWSWFPRHKIEDMFIAWYPGPLVRGSSPSMTFPVRRAVSAIMVPTWFFVDEFVSGYIQTPILLMLTWALYLGFWAGVIYAVAVLACWNTYKRGQGQRRTSSRFWPWARRYWLTRPVLVYVRPPTAAADADDEATDTDMKVEDHEHGREGREGPRPLVSPWAFFTSSSPLDDLLVTYEVTRPFVQPLLANVTLRRRRTQDQDIEGEAGAGTSSSADVKMVESTNVEASG